MKAVVTKIINSVTYRVSWNSVVKNIKCGKYQKIVRNRIVHCQAGCSPISEGDIVSIAPSKPFSKIKRWEIKFDPVMKIN